MGKKVLLVSHSIGDTQAVIDIANHLQKSKGVDPSDICILTVGQAAHDTFFGAKSVAGMHDGAYKGSQVLSLAHEPFKLSLAAKSLEAAQLEMIKAELEKLGLASALIGNPSDPESHVPFQIAELIADHFSIEPLVYNEYSYREAPAAVIENDVARRASWVAKSDIAVVNAKAAGIFSALNADASIVPVGHRIYDQALTAREVDYEKTTATRAALGIQPKDETHLVFYSGCKDTKLDVAAFGAAIEAMKDNPKAKLVLGMHPGHPELYQYAAAMFGVLLEKETYHPELFKENRIKLVIPNKEVSLGQQGKKPLYEMLKRRSGFENSSLLFENCCVNQATVNAEVGGPDLADAANGVLGAVPGQLLFQTGLSGRRAASFEEKEMYVPGVFGGKKYFSSIFEKPAKAASQMTREQCGIPAESMVEAVTTKLGF